MVIIKPHQSEVSLFHIDGVVRIFASITRARQSLGCSWINKHVGKYFCEFSHISHLGGPVPEREVVYTDHEYIMRNDMGEPLTVSDFYVKKTYGYSRYGSWNGTGPVPGTRKWRGGGHHRHIKTMSERRASFPIFEDGEVGPRAARTAVVLPTAWDDLSRSDYGVRSWKKHRKNQWK